jgi:rfaE bifunctional protein nucleotidyltransferase chain/domain
MKILKMKDLDKLRRRHKGKKIVQAHGAFDIVHAGHVLHLEDAKAQGDILVVSITGDKYVRKRKMFFDENLRAHQVAALECVDYVIVIQDHVALSVMKILKPHIYVKGKEYAEIPHPDTQDEKDLLDSYGGKFHFSSTEAFSSTKVGYLSGYLSDGMARGVLAEEKGNFVDLSPTEFELQTLKRYFKLAKEMNVLVIGEKIMDGWAFDEIKGYSVDNKCMAGRNINLVTQTGGAAIVAAHLRDLVGNVDHVGTDVDIVKTRFMDKRRNEATYIHEHYVCPRINMEDVKLEPYDLVVVADFGHGLITHEDASTISLSCDKFLAVQAQTNTENFGFNLPSKYPRAEYYCMNRSEAQLLIGEKLNPTDLIAEVKDRLITAQVSVTLGEDGAMMLNDDVLESMKALSKHVVDAIGCGDAYFSLSALALAMGFNQYDALLLGSIGGALMSMRRGNEAAVTAKEIEQTWKIVT